MHLKIITIKNFEPLPVLFDTLKFDIVNYTDFAQLSLNFISALLKAPHLSKEEKNILLEILNQEKPQEQIKERMIYIKSQFIRHRENTELEIIPNSNNELAAMEKNQITYAQTSIIDPQALLLNQPGNTDIVGNNAKGIKFKFNDRSSKTLIFANDQNKIPQLLVFQNSKQIKRFNFNQFAYFASPASIPLEVLNLLNNSQISNTNLATQTKEIIFPELIFSELKNFLISYYSLMLQQVEELDSILGNEKEKSARIIQYYNAMRFLLSTTPLEQQTGGLW